MAKKNKKQASELLKKANEKRKEKAAPNLNRPMRQIIIETDGRSIRIVKNEITQLELTTILATMLERIRIK